MAKVFINYRKDDSESVVHRIHERLCQVLDADEVFLDDFAIQGGDDWQATIDRHLAEADVLLAIIGKRWMSPENQARLADTGDVLRRELEAAFARDIRVVPVLVERAERPPAEALPPSIARLGSRQAVEVSNRRFDYDMEDLIHVVAPYTEPEEEGGAEAETWGAPPPPALGPLLVGTWDQQVSSPNGAVTLARAQLYPNGTFFVQGGAGMASFAIRGTWSVDPMNQLWLSGQQENGFQVAPYHSCVRFHHVSPTALNGSFATGDRIDWLKLA